jgi:hypothetical protein
MVLRLSVIVQGLVIQFGLRLAPESFVLTRFLYANRCPLRSKTLWTVSSRGLTTRSFGLPVEAIQRRAEIVEHGRKITVQCGPTAD